MGGANSGRRPDQARRRQAAVLRRQGLSFRQIGERLGVGRQAAAHLVHAGGRTLTLCVYVLSCPRCGRAIRRGDYCLRRTVGALCVDCLRRDDPMGVRLRAYRVARGLTQSELAQRAGVCRRTLVIIEAGRQVPRRRTLAMLRQTLRVKGSFA